jgi:hypothetical protein
MKNRFPALILAALSVAAVPSAVADSDDLKMDPATQQLQVDTHPNHTYKIYRSANSLDDWEEFVAMEGDGERVQMSPHPGDAEAEAVFYSMYKRNHFGKKGIGQNFGIQFGTTDPQPLIDAMQAANISWFYNWGTNPPAGVQIPEDIEFVPMVWGVQPEWGEDYVDRLQRSLDRIKEDDSITHLLGYNEPDHSGQSSMTVAEALEYWPMLESTGKRLGSPAMAGKSSALNNGGWLHQFMQGAEARGYRVDFICLHIYQRNFDIDGLLEYCEAAYQKYGLPIWITEWSLVDWMASTAASRQTQALYLKAAVEAMEAVPYIERHAWFALVDSDELNNGPWPMGLFEMEEVLERVDGRRVSRIEVEMTVVGEAMRDAETGPPDDN